MTKTNKMLESIIQKKIINKYEKNGWFVVKLIQTNKNGMPDLMCLRNKEALFIEVKRKGCKPTELQLYRHEQLRKQGFEVKIIDHAN